MRQFKRLVSPLQATLLAIENGENRPPETLELLGAMGMENGITDLALLTNRARIHWIEVKLEATLQHARTDLRPDQREIHDLLVFYDHRISVVRNPDEFWSIVDSYDIAHLPVPPRHEQLILPRPRRSKLARP